MAHVRPERHSIKIIIDQILRKTHIENFVHSLTFHVLSPALRTYLEH